MVTDGVFFGVYKGDELIAAAGTHLVSREERRGGDRQCVCEERSTRTRARASGHRGGVTRAGRHRHGRTERPCR